MPTSLAMNCSSTLADGKYGEIIGPDGSSSPLNGLRRYVGAVTDHNEVEIDETAEIAYLKSTPASTVLGNHFFVLLQLAALQLSATPPNLSDAQLVIDTIAAMLQAGGDRLGEHVELYRNALAEVQQLFVRASLSPNDRAPEA